MAGGRYRTLGIAKNPAVSMSHALSKFRIYENALTIFHPDVSVCQYSHKPAYLEDTSPDCIAVLESPKEKAIVLYHDIATFATTSTAISLSRPIMNKY